MQWMKSALLMILGALLGVLVFTSWPREEQPQVTEAKVDKPLYWVAPMDPDYRRDAPGKSPMGMDLVPVYAEPDVGPGVVIISPQVINNLGVRTTSARLRVMQPEIRTVGYVQYDQDYLIHIHPRVEGWIEKLYVKAAGDPVEKGGPLYDLYSPQLVNAQEELLLAMRRSNEALVQAARDRLAALQLSEEFITSLMRDRQVRQKVTFRSPQKGVVDNLNIREGFFVNPTTTLMSIGALDNVWVEAEVFERQAALVQVGMPVTMTLEYLPGRQWRGRVDYIYPSLDEKTRTLRMRLRFTNESAELRPNMFAQVLLHVEGGSEVLTIPREALIRTGEQDRAVLALGKGRFKSIAVKAGRFDGQHVEILSGLEVDDAVVASAQFLIDSESNKSSDFMRMESGIDTKPQLGDEEHTEHSGGHDHD